MEAIYLHSYLPSIMFSIIKWHVCTCFIKSPFPDEPCGAASAINHITAAMAGSAISEEIQAAIKDILENNQHKLCQASENEDSETTSTTEVTTTEETTTTSKPKWPPLPTTRNSRISGYFVDCVGAVVGDYSLRSADPSCKTFLQCVRGRHTFHTCGDGTLFDVTINVCNWTPNVRCPLAWLH